MIEQRRGMGDNRPGVQDYQRYLKGMLERAATDDPEGFAQVVALIDKARADLALAARRLRQDEGYSWADLARALGVKPQSARERFELSASAQAVLSAAAQ